MANGIPVDRETTKLVICILDSIQDMHRRYTRLSNIPTLPEWQAWGQRFERLSMAVGESTVFIDRKQWGDGPLPPNGICGRVCMDALSVDREIARLLICILDSIQDMYRQFTRLPQIPPDHEWQVWAERLKRQSVAVGEAFVLIDRNVWNGPLPPNGICGRVCSGLRQP